MPVKTTINVEPIEVSWSTSMTNTSFVDEAYRYLNSQIRPRLLPLLAELKKKSGYNFTTPQVNPGYSKKSGFTFIENVDDTPVLIKISIDDKIEKVKFYAKSKEGVNEPLEEYCSLTNVTLEYIEAFIRVAINHYLKENYTSQSTNEL
ncbi:MAG: hypothetical protein ACM3VS_04175 [Candidatus Dadabacteria bacterium]